MIDVIGCNEFMFWRGGSGCQEGLGLGLEYFPRDMNVNGVFERMGRGDG